MLACFASIALRGLFHTVLFTSTFTHGIFQSQIADTVATGCGDLGDTLINGACFDFVQSVKQSGELYYGRPVAELQAFVRTKPNPTAQYALPLCHWLLVTMHLMAYLGRSASHAAS